MKMDPRLKSTLLFGSALLFVTAVAQAQIGSGWTQYSPSKGYSGWSQSQRYSISGSTEHFWVYKTDPITPSGSGPRSEWHVNNTYSSGSQQFQGSFNAESGTTGYTVFQIFGNAGGNATALQLQMRSADGTLRHYNDTAVATGCWGVYKRINVIHYTSTGSIEVWVNGSKKGTWNDGGPASHYFKYGCYDTGTGSSTSSRTGSYWQSVKFFKK